MSRIAARGSLLVGLLWMVGAGCANLPDDETGQAVQEARRRQDQGGTSGPLDSRILLNQDGTADFESATATLDGTTAPTNPIERMALTVFDNAGNTALAENYPVVNRPYYWRRLSGVARGQPFQVTAKVDLGNSLSSVTVPGIARLRPDLAFNHIIGPERPNGIIGPERARVGRPMLFQARVLELNGDTGASFTFALSVDGVVVRSSISSVAAGGGADFRLSYAFETVGRHDVALSIEQVKPGEYDPSNNTYRDAVWIIGPE